MAYLSTTLAFLSRALASAPLRRITRAVLATIQATLWDNVLTRYRFSTAGAAQLQADLSAICRVVDKSVGPAVAESGLRKCLEGAQLVGLAVKGGKDQAATSSSSSSSTTMMTGTGGDDDPEGSFLSRTDEPGGGEDEDEWDASWGADEPPPQQALPPATDDGPQKANPPGHTSSWSLDPDALGLWEVEKRLFADNASARDVLDQLGIELLTETEARALLRRRVELAA